MIWWPVCWPFIIGCRHVVVKALACFIDMMGPCLFRVHQLAVHWKSNTNLFKQWLWSPWQSRVSGFWWYHGILLVHLQDSVGAFGAKWLTKWLHHAKAPSHGHAALRTGGNKDVHLVTTFVFCHVSKCYFSTGVSLRNVSVKCRSLVQVTPMD